MQYKTWSSGGRSRRQLEIGRQRMNRRRNWELDVRKNKALDLSNESYAVSLCDRKLCLQCKEFCLSADRRY